MGLIDLRTPSSLLKRRKPYSDFCREFQLLLQKESKRVEWRNFLKATKQGPSPCTSNRPPCIRLHKEFCLFQKGSFLELLEKKCYRKNGRHSDCNCINYGPHCRIINFWTPSNHSKFSKKVRDSIKW